MSSYRTERQVIPEVQAVIDAWVVQGPVPLYHEAKKDQLRDEWPALASALDALAEPPR